MKQSSKVIASGLLITAGGALGLFGGEKALDATREPSSALRPTIDKCAAAIVKLENQPIGSIVISPTVDSADCDELSKYVAVSVPTEPMTKDEIVTDITETVDNVYNSSRIFDDLVGLALGVAVPAGALWVLAEHKRLRQEKIIIRQIEAVFTDPTTIDQDSIEEMNATPPLQ